MWIFKLRNLKGYFTVKLEFTLCFEKKHFFSWSGVRTCMWFQLVEILAQNQNTIFLLYYLEN